MKYNPCLRYKELFECKYYMCKKHGGIIYTHVTAVRSREIIDFDYIEIGADIRFGSATASDFGLFREQIEKECFDTQIKRVINQLKNLIC